MNLEVKNLVLIKKTSFSIFYFLRIYEYVAPYKISRLRGLIDGYIAITKIGLDNIRMELILSVYIKDLKLLQHIQNVLKIGRINQYPNISTVKLMPLRGGKVAHFF